MGLLRPTVCFCIMRDCAAGLGPGRKESRQAWSNAAAHLLRSRTASKRRLLPRVLDTETESRVASVA